MSCGSRGPGSRHRTATEWEAKRRGPRQHPAARVQRGRGPQLAGPGQRHRGSEHPGPGECPRWRCRSSRTRAPRRRPGGVSGARLAVAVATGRRRPPRRAAAARRPGDPVAEGARAGPPAGGVERGDRGRSTARRGRPRADATLGAPPSDAARPGTTSGSTAGGGSAVDGRQAGVQPTTCRGRPRVAGVGTLDYPRSGDSLRKGHQGLSRPGRARPRPGVGRRREGRVRLPRRHLRLRQVHVPAPRAARVPAHVGPGLRRRQGDQPAGRVEGAAVAAPDRHRLPGLPAAAEQDRRPRTSRSRCR